MSIIPGQVLVWLGKAMVSGTKSPILVLIAPTMISSMICGVIRGLTKEKSESITLSDDVEALSAQDFSINLVAGIECEPAP